MRASWHVWDRGIGWEIHSGPTPADPHRSCGRTCSAINTGDKDTFDRETAELIVQRVMAFEALLAVAKAAMADMEIQSARPGPVQEDRVESVAAAVDAFEVLFREFPGWREWTP